MMLRSLVSEVVRRRLWPIPVAAILIAIAAPLLFMKSAPGTPVGTPPPVAAPGELPAGAERLVTTSDKATTPRAKTRPKGQDPFAPPAGSAKVTEDTAAAPVAQATTATVSTPPSGSVVIRNSDGSTATMEVPKINTKKASSKKKSTTRKKAPAKKTTPKATGPVRTTSSASSAPKAAYVDVRFGKRKDSMLRYRVPRLQTFRAGGRVAAMFSHYSETRDVAVFAIAPSTSVAGDVDCRKVKGVCRYVDIPAGSYARLRLRDTNGTLISRRLDVVSIRHLAGTDDPMPRATTLDTARCLLKGLLRLPASLPSISVDACD